MKLLFIGTLTVLMLAGCGKKGKDVESTNDSMNIYKDMSLEEFRQTYMGKYNNNLIGNQDDTYFVGNAELGDPLTEAASDLMIEWEGYTERELGMLSPDEMPNVQENEGVHYILYDHVAYQYVNDFNALNMNIGNCRDYANVWVNVQSDGSLVILGGLEEYGKECAAKIKE